MKRSLLLALVTCAVLILPASARAAFILTITESGNDVLVTGSGTIDLTELTYLGNGDQVSIMTPSEGVVYNGSGGFEVYGWISSDPFSFGPGSLSFASISSGSSAGISRASAWILVPEEYVSGDFISNSATYSNQTLASLGLTAGSYTSTWGSDETADSMTVNIVAVPEPATAGMMAAGVGLLLLRMRKRPLRA